MRLFLDASILFSAAWRDEAHALLLFRLATAGICRLTTSRLAVEEARRNIAHKRANRMASLDSLINKVELGQEPKAQQLEVAKEYGLPAKDIPILAAAIVQQADLLVTGDRRDFGHLYDAHVASTKIIGLADAIKHVLDSS